MAGAQELEIMEREAQKSLMAIAREHSNHWQWNVQFARCFTYPSSYHSQTAAITSSPSSSPPSSLCPLKRGLFKPLWISSSETSVVSLHRSADGFSSSNSILTVSLRGTVVEEHFISALQFAWPQVSCLSGFPTRGSLVVLASYVDNLNEKQKFAMRFPRISDVEDFITSVENILSKKVSDEHPAVDAISAISSQSEFIPPYRPDTLNMRTPICDATTPKNFHHKYHQDSVTQDTFADSKSHVEAYPPRFTSLVSSCSAEPEEGKLALALSDGPQDLTLKAQISKYMQDASFLDIVSKVNEVISELGGNFVV